jgi:hypothetical protein
MVMEVCIFIARAEAAEMYGIRQVNVPIGFQAEH